MRTLLHTSAVTALLAVAVPTVSAQNAAACQSVEFSPRVLERAPNIREACLDVITRGDEQFAVIKSDLIGTARNSIRVRFKRPDGSPVESRTIAVNPKFRVLIDGKPTPIADVAIGQELTAYVKVTEPVVTLAPAADEQPLEMSPLAEEPPVIASSSGPALPRTASMLPALAVGGFLLILVGCGLTLDRFVYSRLRRLGGTAKESRYE